MFRDGHHILHHRQEWTLRPEAAVLRETPSLIVRINRADHNEVHRRTPPIPLLGFHALQRVNREFEPVPDTFKTLDSLIRAIEIASKSPKSHSIESRLCELAIESIVLQRDTLRELL